MLKWAEIMKICFIVCQVCCHAQKWMKMNLFVAILYHGYNLLLYGHQIQILILKWLSTGVVNTDETPSAEKTRTVLTVTSATLSDAGKRQEIMIIEGLVSYWLAT